MEIYLTHYLLLNLIKTKVLPSAESVQGVAMIAVNYIVTVAVVCFAVILLNANKISRLILFGNSKD